MNKFTFVAAASLLAGLASCQKKEYSRPAVIARVYSISYVTPQENNLVVYTATVELKKTDGTYDEKQYITGNGELAFENLKPGEYWINEETSRHSETIMLGVDEKREIDFTLP